MNVNRLTHQAFLNVSQDRTDKMDQGDLCEAYVSNAEHRFVDFILLLWLTDFT